MEKWLIVLILIAAAARIAWDIRRWSKKGASGNRGTAIILCVILGFTLLFLGLRWL